ncbi:MAG TPA: hypothetical protein VN256_08025, partial [Pyrinomonadaceae bacterium]|nr:hypothetical protein [Pyrinomonadaceae bacterium]
MSKELIVSVNGREKKIAIIENERVTEFYIERGEENQGIVGNIYKGRVMRVLPGMQSAFVDIGLERDAFLYVSDFFDEEEEFERIVMDKTKKAADPAEAARAARGAIEQARVEREQHIEAAQERVEPLLDAEPLAAEEAVEPEVLEAVEEVEEPLAATSDEPFAQAEAQAEETAREGGRKRGRRGKRRGRGGEEHAAEAPAASASDERAASPAYEDVSTPFIADASFQRVVDEDETAAENGEMFKDARIQERIFDQIHAVEFDMEDVPATEVGSLLGSETPQQGSFQRVEDDDVSEAEDRSEAAYVQETVAAHVGAFIDEINEETVGTSQTFERVSDDEGAEEAAEPKSKRAAKRGATKRASKKEAEVEEAAKPKRAAKAAAKKAAAKKSSKKASKKSRTAATEESGEGETDIAVLESEAERAESADLVAAEAADGEHFEAGAGGNGDYEDAEATLSSGRSRGELATRRGGRRRRRPTGKSQDGNGEDRTNGKDEEVVEAVAEVEEAPSKRASAPQPRSDSRRERGERDRGERAVRERPERGPREERSPREDRGAREER